MSLFTFWINRTNWSARRQVRLRRETVLPCPSARALLCCTSCIFIAQAASLLLPHRMSSSSSSLDAGGTAALLHISSHSPLHWAMPLLMGWQIWQSPSKAGVNLSSVLFMPFPISPKQERLKFSGQLSYLCFTNPLCLAQGRVTGVLVLPSLLSRSALLPF